MVDYRYCLEDATRRAADVLSGRGKVVSITNLPVDPDEPAALRDERGRFCGSRKYLSDNCNLPPTPDGSV